MVRAFVTPITTSSKPVMSSVPVSVNVACGGATMIGPPRRVMSLPPRAWLVDIPNQDFCRQNVSGWR